MVTGIRKTRIITAINTIRSLAVLFFLYKLFNKNIIHFNSSKEYWKILYHNNKFFSINYCIIKIKVVK